MQLNPSPENRRNKDPKDLERFDDLLSDYSKPTKQQQDDIEELLMRKIEGTQDPKNVQSYIEQLESYRGKSKAVQKKTAAVHAGELVEIREDLEEIRYLLAAEGHSKQNRDLSQIFAIVFALVFSLLAFLAMVEMAYLLSLAFFVGALSSLVLAVGPSLVKQWKRLED